MKYLILTLSYMFVALTMTLALLGQARADGYQQGARLYAQDGTYLGNLNNNQYDANSISNPYGQYGSKYSAKSINNPYSMYGNKYSTQYVPAPYHRSDDE